MSRDLIIVTTKLLEMGMAAPFQSAADTDTRLEHLLERYATLLRSLIARHCPRHLGLDVADIEQEARLRLWRALDREKELADPASYIYRIAVTTTIDAVRRVLARREDQLRMQPGNEDEPAERPSPTTSPAH